MESDRKTLDEPGWFGDAGDVAASVTEAKRVRKFVPEGSRATLDAYVDANGDLDAAAKALGVTPSIVHAKLAQATKDAARRGLYAVGDMDKPTPEGYHVAGVSTMYTTGPDGEKQVRAQWVKSKADPGNRLKLLGDAISGLAEPFRGCVDPTPAPVNLNSDLLNVFPMGDPHVGMYAWAEETGHSFDLDICTRNIRSAMSQTIAQAPKAERALFVLLGDNFHADNNQNRTARSGNALDVDTRWPKVLREGIRVFRWCVDELAKSHETVDVVVVIGNHDDHSAVMLAIALELAYENEPRVNILRTAGKFHYYQFGANLFGITHGDTCKHKDLPGIMAADVPEMWGSARHRRWMTGHVHHESVKDFHACSVETFRILAPGDAWHNGAGYRADRDMRCDVYHREHGLITRHITGIDRVEAFGQPCT